MKKSLLIAAQLLLCTTVAFAGTGSIERRTNPARDSYIIELEEITPKAESLARELAAQHGGRIRHVFNGEPWSGFSIENLPEAAASALGRNPRVKRVHEMAQAQLAQVVMPPADWALDRISQRYLPLNGAVATKLDPSVNIYVLDSGINDPAGTQFSGYYGNRLIHGYTVVFTTAGAPYYGDVNNHGTGVAAIIAGNTYGVTHQAPTVHNVKVIGSPSSTLPEKIDRIIAGIRDYVTPTALATQYRDIANLSSFIPGGDDLLDQEILYSMTPAGGNVTWVVGAGNGDSIGNPMDACTGSPARLGRPANPSDPTSPSVITVGASTLVYNEATGAFDRDARASWSNYGPCVDLYAPGEYIRTMDKNGATKSQSVASGTSYSAPYVAGELTGLISGTSTYTSAQVEQILKDRATKDVLDASTLHPGSSNCTIMTGCATPNMLLSQYRIRTRP
jgi:hypothetical protein